MSSIKNGLSQKIKDQGASFLLFLGQRLAGLCHNLQKWSSLESFCKKINQISPNGKLLEDLQLMVAKKIIEAKIPPNSPLTINNQLDLALGDLKPLVIGDSLFRRKDFADCEKFYTIHQNQYRKDSAYQCRVKKIAIGLSETTTSKPKGEQHRQHPVNDKKRPVIYTAIFGNYDSLTDPAEPGPFDYVCLTDQDFDSKIWQIQKVDVTSTPLSQSRHCKFFPHLYFSEYSHSLYMDGNMQLTADPSTFIETELQENHFAMFSHSLRNCLYDEARAVLQRAKADFTDIKNQIEKYYSLNIPQNHGLFEAGIIWRDHHRDDVKDFMNYWWKEFQQFPHRDQLSLAYTMWKLNYSPQPISEEWGTSQKSLIHCRKAHQFETGWDTTTNKSIKNYVF